MSSSKQQCEQREQTEGQGEVLTAACLRHMVGLRWRAPPALRLTARTPALIITSCPTEGSLHTTAEWNISPEGSGLKRGALQQPITVPQDDLIIL